jgi:hypothetical protein
VGIGGDGETSSDVDMVRVGECIAGAALGDDPSPQALKGIQRVITRINKGAEHFIVHLLQAG